ncbi:MAG: hypothetical protein KUG77_19685 [Nannocystaceae bacterium]|nr:hypothetical protein [Nannocystaceae bacterium]
MMFLLRICLPLSLCLIGCESEPRADPAPKDAPKEAEKTAAGSKASTSAEADAEEELSPLSEYQRKSMRAEAMVNTRGITDLLRARAVGGDSIQSLGVTPPAGSCCKKPKGQCSPEDGSWDEDGWKVLGFRPSAPHRYSYQVDVSGPTVTVTATADLDCDGTLSTYAYEGLLADEDITFDFDKDPVETNALD